MMEFVGMILGVGSLIVSFALSGYVARALRITAGTSLFPNAQEAVFGYAVSGLICTLSLIVVGSGYPGMAIVSVASLAALLVALRDHRGRWTRIRLSLPLTIKLLFVTLVAVIYGPMLTGASASYRLPEIFELPKHIAATISLAHATRWPAPNPFFPDLPFAYNTLFYMPLGVATRLMGVATAYGPVFTLALLWTTWYTLGCFETIMGELGIGPRWQSAGLLLATFMAGFTPLVIATNVPIGVAVSLAHRSRIWVDDPLVSFLSVPQHIFSLACLLVAWLFVQRALKRPPLLLAAAVSAGCGALASYILAPVDIAAFVAIVSWAGIVEPRVLGERLERRMVMWTLGAVAIALGIAAPFMLQAARWAGSANLPLLAVPALTREWMYVALMFGWLLPLSLCGILALVRARGVRGLRYPILFLPAVFVVLAVPDSDFMMKSTMFLRFGLAPIGALGLAAIWRAIPAGYAPVGRTVIGAAIATACLSSLLLIGYYLATAYIRRPAADQRVLEEMRALPFDTAVLLLSPNQEDLAVGGHLAFMDASVYRKDAYLPSTARLAARQRLEHYVRDWCVPAGIGGVWDPVARQFSQSFDGSSDQSARAVDAALHWTLWSPTPDLERNRAAATRVVESTTPTDAALLAPVHLSQGLHRVTVDVGGVVEGHAHLSFHGVRKLIDIPAGDYRQGGTFSTLLAIDAPGFDGNWAFGLGGWALGAGRVELRDLRVERLGRCGDGARP